MRVSKSIPARMLEIDPKREFGTAVRENRNRLGLSQETLAERANLHRTYISGVEQGVRNLSLESISKLARALEISIAALFPPHRSAADLIEPLEILLVEDSQKDIELTLAAFKEARLHNPVRIVRDGAAALDYFFPVDPNAQTAGAHPALLLLDLQLPKIHGLEVLRRLKADERTRQIHIVVLTSSRSDEQLREALRLGAECWIAKPVDFRNLSAITPQLNLGWTLHSQRAE